MYGVTAYGLWGSNDMHDIMKQYRKEHYESSPRLPKPDNSSNKDESAESSDDDCRPPKRRASRPGLRSAKKRGGATLEGDGRNGFRCHVSLRDHPAGGCQTTGGGIGGGGAGRAGSKSEQSVSVDENRCMFIVL